jgi:hypothetical protein
MFKRQGFHRAACLPIASVNIRVISIPPQFRSGHG